MLAGTVVVGGTVSWRWLQKSCDVITREKMPGVGAPHSFQRSSHEKGSHSLTSCKERAIHYMLARSYVDMAASQRC